MLTQLYIQNIAVIQKADIHLAPGLNVFTGETGAGKTILVSAIEAVLGERTSRDIIRAGEEKALVSALFENISIRAKKVLTELGYEDEDGAVLITREITAAGKNTCKIGGMPATVGVLKEISSKLIHIHGQRDAAQLLDSAEHLGLVDSFGELQNELEVYKQAYETLCVTRSRLEELSMDDAQKAQRIDMLRFQINEIEAAKLADPTEEEELLSRKKMIQGSEKIRTGLADAYGALEGGGESDGIIGLMDILSGGVAQAARYMDSLEAMAKRVEEIRYELSDFSADIHEALDDFEFDPRELDRLEYRLDTIYKLKRKYGADIASILEYYGRVSEELENITTSEQRTAELQALREKQEKEACRLAAQLSDKRLKAAQKLTRQVEDELTFLDMPSVRISVKHNTCTLSPSGIDEMELYIVTNIGEEPKPLSKIASGGELARIMLAIKNVLADRDDIDTLIFDEVDAGVSGRAAGKIGQKLMQVSGKRQVVCVTHLAQVAAFADNHLLIAKQVEDGRTYTRVSALGHVEVISELARITGGDAITEAALQNASELWERAHGAQ